MSGMQNPGYQPSIYQQMKKILLLMTGIVLLFLLSCDKKQDTEEDPPVEETNQPPGLFGVTVDKVSFDYALLKWTGATDPDGDSLYYSVFINNHMVAGDLQNTFGIRIGSLQPETEYSGYIRVTDSVNQPVDIPFGFTTRKYVILFNNSFRRMGDASSEAGFSIDKTSDGGYVSAGNIYYNGNHHLWIVKVDSMGSLQWEKSIEQSTWSVKGVIRQTPDNGYVVVNQNKIYKLFPNGDVQWMFPPDFMTCEYNGLALCDEGYLAFGTMQGAMAGLTRLGANGEVLWDKYYSSGEMTHGNYICETADGNFILLGVTGPGSDMDFCVLKVSREGDLIWEKTYHDNDYDFAMQIKPTADQGYIIAGFSWDSRDVSSARVIKIDGEGNITWNKSFLWDSFKTYAKGIEQTSDGGYIFTGSNGYQQEASLLVKLDAHGELEWKKSFYPNLSMFKWDGRDIKVTADNGFIVSGVKSNLGFGASNDEGLWILKTDEYGNYEY